MAERNIELFIRRTWGLAPEAYRTSSSRPIRARPATAVIDGFDRLLAPEPAGGAGRRAPLAGRWGSSGKRR